MTASLIPFFVALALLIVSNIWMIVAGFRVSILWGLLNLLLSPAQFVFLFVHWPEARKPFLCSIAGLLFLLPAVLLNLDQFKAPDGFFAKVVAAEMNRRSGIDPHPKSPFIATPAPTPAPTLAARRATLIQRADELKTKYDELQATWARLSPTDQQGRAAFDARAAQYAALRKEVEAEKAAMEALQASASR